MEVSEHTSENSTNNICANIINYEGSIKHEPDIDSLLDPTEDETFKLTGEFENDNVMDGMVNDSGEEKVKIKAEIGIENVSYDILRPIPCEEVNIKQEYGFDELSIPLIDKHSEEVKDDEFSKRNISGTVKTNSNDNFETASNNEICRQSKVKSNKKLFSCDRCKYKTDRKDCLYTHQCLQKKNGRGFTCIFCSKLFFDKRSFDCHLFVKHKREASINEIITSKIHQCPECSYRSLSSHNIKLHLLTHKKQKFRCEHCDYSAYCKNALEKHLDNHKTSFLCTECKKSFRRRAYLDGHIFKDHFDNKNLMAKIRNPIYECQHCSYKSIVKSNFETHMLKHKGLTTDLKKLKCEYCDYSSCRLSILQKHILTHSCNDSKKSNSRRFICTTCNLNYVCKINRDDHIITHHADNQELMATISCAQLKCQQCPYMTVIPEKLKKHMFKHNELKLDLDNS